MAGKRRAQQMPLRVDMVGVENTFEVTDDGAKCITGDAYELLCVEE